MWNEGDWDGIRELYAPDATLEAVEGWPEPGPQLGRGAIMRQWARMREDFGEGQLAAVDLAEQNDWVLCDYVWSVQGAQSGIEGEFRTTGAARIDNGKIVEQCFYWSRSEALRAIAPAE